MSVAIGLWPQCVGKKHDAARRWCKVGNTALAKTEQSLERSARKLEEAGCCAFN